MKKKIFIGIVLSVGIIVLFGIGYILNGLFGNPISHKLAEKELDAYIRETYPEMVYTMDDGIYDFKFGTYEFNVGDENNGRVYKMGVYVRGWKNQIRDEIRFESLDQKLMKKIGNQATAELDDILRPRISSLENVFASVEIVKGEFDESVKWDKDMPLSSPMNIYIELNSTHQSKEDFLKEVRLLQSLLNENGFTYDKVNVNGKLMEGEIVKQLGAGPLLFSVTFKKDDKIRLRHVHIENARLHK